MPENNGFYTGYGSYGSMRSGYPQPQQYPTYPQPQQYPTYPQPQPVLQSTAPTPPPPPPPTQNSIQWVQGEAGAKAYDVKPGQTVLLMDSETNVFYIKSVDINGMPLPLEIYDYTKRTARSNSTPPELPQIDLSGFVTKEEFEKRLSEIAIPRKTTVKKTDGE